MTFLRRPVGDVIPGNTPDNRSVDELHLPIRRMLDKSGFSGGRAGLAIVFAVTKRNPPVPQTA